YSLYRPTLPALPNERWAFPFGFVAGVLGSAYNTSGPPVIIYGTMRRWPPDLFRATLQGFFLVSNMIVIAGHGLAGLWTQEVLLLTLLSLPVLVTAVIAGAMVNRRIPAAQFARVVYLLLIILGAIFILPLWL
nr:TSUP family transporter [Caldilineaceae bacterium]